MDRNKCSLSIVCVSRNDDHGGNLRERTQCFIDGIAQRFGGEKSFVELVLVEWNPPSDKPRLSDSLDWQRIASSSVCVRVIEVPAELHQRFAVSDRLPLLQMIGKNVGIRRARGEFVLCTNIDVIFSEPLSRLLVSGDLQRDRMYRAERVDVRESVARAPVEQIDDVCRDAIIRRNQRAFPLALAQALTSAGRINLVDVVKRFPIFHLETFSDDWVLKATETTKPELLFTNACGDFTLLHRDSWSRIRGYPEFDAFSFNIDSLGCYLAHYNGFLESTFVPPSVCYHIEHATGSGWTPEGEKILFSRLRSLRLLWPEWGRFMPIIRRMRAEGYRPVFNEEHWGLKEFFLPEVTLELTGKWRSTSTEQIHDSTLMLPLTPVSALRQEWMLTESAQVDLSLFRRGLGWSFGVLCRVFPRLADFLYCNFERRT